MNDLIEEIVERVREIIDNSPNITFMEGKFIGYCDDKMVHFADLSGLDGKHLEAITNNALKNYKEEKREVEDNRKHYTLEYF